MLHQDIDELSYFPYHTFLIFSLSMCSSFPDQLFSHCGHVVNVREAAM